LDGTWNGPDVSKGGVYTPTNVQLLYESLQGSGPLASNDLEKEFICTAGGATAIQVGKYLYGVGDATNAIAHACEGAVGLGLVGRIVRGYTYVSRVYEPGDQIHLVGFSRGAYTARALAGLIASQGLLDWKAMRLDAQSPASYSAGLAAWQRCKATMHADDPGVLHGIAAFVTDLHDGFESALHPPPALKFVRDVPIASVAVWDTVGALGVPDVQETDGTKVRVDVFQFADTRLGNCVQHGFHAVAVDEQRVDFTPTLWESRDRVVQVLFPGAHADVGGGYLPIESGLASYTLSWMIRQLASVGVLFSAMPQPAKGAADVMHRPWAAGQVPFNCAPRHFGPGLRLSQRVLQRLGAGLVPIEGQGSAQYRPQNLANSYVLLDWTGAAPHVEIEP
jgi:uncharacterized protein (DUF2235 family)